MMRVRIEGVELTVSFLVMRDGVLYVEMEERPGELFRASRCEIIN